MCGIVGVFNHVQAEEQVKTALAILKNRGKDGSNILKLENGYLGHTLHAVVNHILQPIQKEGILSANCEIYNWQELNKQYGFDAKNDAELLLSFLDRFGINKLDELDGVYSFAYVRKNFIYISRDIFGVKPLWFSYNIDGFSFSSEKKSLEKLGYIDIQELNPRQTLRYDTSTKKLDIFDKEFLNYLPEHLDGLKILEEKTKILLDQAIEKRVPKKKFGLLFSGGIDSTYLAKYFKDNNYDFTCYTTVLDSETIPSDLEYAQKAAEELGLKLKIRKIKQEEIPRYLEKIIPLIEDSNVVKVGVALTFYLACEMAKEDGCKVIFSGLGSEEIFAGYERHKNSTNINQECLSGLRKIYERDLYRDDVLTMDNNLELRLPFLDRRLVEYALKIPSEYKIKDGVTKLILRNIALDNGIKEQFSFRKKTAAQYGSRIDNALGKLARKNGFQSKSSYLRIFYPMHNLKLGVLFSSGKDSVSSAHIMQKQNYLLTCLIHIRSKNKDSYMFQTAGTEIVELQAEAMGLPIIIQETEGQKEEELMDLEKALKKAKEQYQIEGVVSGALFSTYQRDRIEKVCDRLGLKIFSPLWHKPQDEHMQEIIDNGFEVILTSVAADGLDKTWLGKRIDLQTLKNLQKLNLDTSLNLAGEGGEFESLVLDGPIFNKKIVITSTEIEEDNKNTARLIIKEAKLEEK